MGAIDPAHRIRPGFDPQEQESATLPILGFLLSAVWAIGQTGNLTRDNECAMEQLQNAELRGLRAAEAARLTMSRLTEREYDDELAEEERNCEQTEPDVGFSPGAAHRAEFHGPAARPLGRPGHRDGPRGQQRPPDLIGYGALTDLDGLDRLDLRAAIGVLERLADRTATHSRQQ
ncbi:hypothetical protein GCM10010387_50180 [Streptomyces inusitatus]|uniref:Uncharacterized protein n=1 Tax=Streptomyces inusitatus TaxID=68221 RepID=A0A918QIF8_9ACTN|nr:hypothetical protein [Streptomyces inusitatus]GGZ49855.1 hypothetical protein GCM10010387_50180 [Streptomyces inusitatus]